MIDSIPGLRHPREEHGKIGGAFSQDFHNGRPEPQFYFTEHLRKMAGAVELGEHKSLFGDLLEAAVVSEYHRRYPDEEIFFARTHCPPDIGEISEIDLVDQTNQWAYEVELTDGSGYKGFALLSDRPEMQGFDFTMLQAENYVRLIYEWGVAAYPA